MFDKLPEGQHHRSHRHSTFVDRPEDAGQGDLGFALCYLGAFAEDFGTARAVLPPLSNPHPHTSMLALAEAATLKSFSTHEILAFVRRWN